MQVRVAALILADTGLFLGSDLIFRAAVMAGRAGVERIHITGEHPYAVGILNQLRRRGLDVTWTPSRIAPFKRAPLADQLLVIDANAIFEPGALIAALKQSSENTTRALFVNEAVGNVETGVAVLPEAIVDRVRNAPTICDAMQAIVRDRLVDHVASGTKFCRRADHTIDLAALEYDYLARTNDGRSEGYIARQIRRLSIPVSRRLLDSGVTASQVTLAGLGFAMLAALAFSAGGYWAGIVGASLYAFSTVLDCSDGEIARGSLDRPPSAKRLETIAKYLSYFVVLAGIVWGGSAIAAAIASLGVVLTVRPRIMRNVEVPQLRPSDHSTLIASVQAIDFAARQ